jgi:hypothetical protein
VVESVVPAYIDYNLVGRGLLKHEVDVHYIVETIKEAVEI